MPLLGPGLLLVRPWGPIHEVGSSSVLSHMRPIFHSMSHSCHVLLTHVMCGKARLARVDGGDYASTHDDDEHDYC